VRRDSTPDRPAVAAAMMPGLAWLSYSACATAGAKLRDLTGHSRLIAAAVFAYVAFDCLCFAEPR
jgi:hypothetical protein